MRRLPQEGWRTMAELKHYTPAEMLALLDELYGEDTAGRERALTTMNGWVERGDSVVVYENAELGHPNLGHKKIFSFGSGAAMFEPQHLQCHTCNGPLVFEDEQYRHQAPDIDHDPIPAPPQRLPDMGGDINWRYQLVGIYEEGDTL